MSTSDFQIVQDNFGILEQSKGNFVTIKRFTLTNQNGVTAQVINYGATLTSLKVPDQHGQFDDIILGFDDMEGYLGLKVENPYIGATIGRVTNRIAEARFKLDGHQIQLNVNGHDPVNGDLHKHGGVEGFDKKIWDAHVDPVKGLTLSYLSKDGEEGYPGDVLINITFKLTSNDLSISYRAISTKRTPVAVTINPYFNLSGHQSANNGLANHLVLINADNFTPVDKSFLPIGEITTVEGTEFDFRTSQNLAKLLDKFPTHFNHNFCLNGKSGTLRLAARVEQVANGRILEIWTNQPGIQFYTSGFLPNFKSSPMEGKDGAKYFRNGAFCLQTQNYPNAVNQLNFPDPILNPGEIYHHDTLFRFLIAN